jgi:hypothetical protein
MKVKYLAEIANFIGAEHNREFYLQNPLIKLKYITDRNSLSLIIFHTLSILELQLPLT